MNEYIKIDKPELTFDFWLFGKIGDWNGNAPKNAIHYTLNFIRICLL